MALGDWKMVIGNCKRDLLAGNMHFPRFLGVGGREPAFFLGFLMVRVAAGGRDKGRMTLECWFAGRWGGTIGREY